MKKIIIGALLLLSALSMGQFKFDPAPDTVSLKGVAVRTLTSDNPSWRAGLGFPIFNVRDEKTFKSVATVDVLVLSDAEDFNRTFLGGCFNVPVVSRKHVELGVALGWSGDFARIERVKDSFWMAGVSLTVRF